MGIITKEVEIKVSRDAYKYWKMGYDVPMKKKDYKDGHKTKLPNNMILDTSKTMKIKIEDLTEHSHAPIEVECDFCGRHYTTCNDALHNHTSFIESGLILCEHCAKTKYFVGEKACRYDKNKTDEEREKVRYSLEYVNMLKRIRIRDNNKCIVCSSKSNLVVHHLNGYTDFVDERCDDNNCVLLCENCHKNFHHIYGYLHNTKKQFEEWLGKTLKIKTDENKKLEEARKFYCYETNRIYNNIYEYMNEFKLKNKNIRSCIRACCKNIRNATSYRNLHFVFADKIENMNYDEKIKYLLDIILEKDKKMPFIDLFDGVVYFSGQQCKKYSDFNKNRNLTDLKFKNESILNGECRFIPYYKFISFDEETQKKLCNKSIKLFNILEYKSM